jgi:hypothetical protein
MYLSLVEFAYNNAWHQSIGTTHFMLNYGQHPLTPLNCGISRCHVQLMSSILYKVKKHEFVQLMSSILYKIKKHLLAVQNRQKSYADTKRKEHSFDIGIQVLLGTFNNN